MPSQDGKGPEGKGPKTGRQCGKCENANPCNNGMDRRRFRNQNA